MRYGKSFSLTKMLVGFAVLLSGMAQAAPPVTSTCTLNGKTIKNCSPAQQKQAARQAARKNAAPVQKRTTLTFAGISPSTAAVSPLAATAPSLMTTAATMTPAQAPDYFGVGNYANSPLPSIANGATVTVGNPLVARAYATDFAPVSGSPALAPVFVVVQTPLPTGQLNAFMTFNQLATGGSPGPSAGNAFYAYVLRPTGTVNVYTAVYASALFTVPTTTNPSGEVATFPVSPGVQVQQGDVLAFYGQGVPVDTGSGTDILSTPAPIAPVLNDTITLGSASFPIYPQQRTYSFAATVLDLSGNKITLAGGMRKFQNALPGICGVSPWTTDGTTAGKNDLGQCMPLATKDTSVTFAGDALTGGSDFYRIGLKEYPVKMHADVPATNVRGYFDVQAGASATPQYLGPMIIATRNRPVRILFENDLAPGGKLSVPVDTTYMGAGTVNDGTRNEAASDQRAVVHLHGGNTPWISDGTPHQWITPVGDSVSAAFGFAKGFSNRNVPDMVSLVPDTLTDGKTTYYFTNQQSGRLMFYHEHAYGTTRLGVYAGAAAGYLLVDPAQESALAAATAPGTIITDPSTGAIVSADLAHVIPLIIQDKTFVPDSGVIGGQLAAQDPTWDVGRWGGAGSFWFPHVYMPNQNPADITGANGFGRWDYGPWFWPPQDPSTFVAGGQPYQCNSAAYPGGAGLAYPPLMCPGTPQPSGTPESFMDTPVVNGTAYPTLTVDPTAYRFQVLNAANDRSLNLGIYKAEPVTLSPVITNPGSGYTSASIAIGNCTGGSAIAQIGDGIDPSTAQPFTSGIVGITMLSQPSACSGTPTLTITDPQNPGLATLASASVVTSEKTDVRMVAAIPVTAGRALPNCATKLPMAGGGQVSALLDASGNLLNGPTGLPANCWPLYSNAQGYTAGPFGENGGQLSWGNSDARTGGIPDPTMAGPPIIQLGAEGGVLPRMTVIPSTPVSFDYNKRSITVLNVLNHGLWVGPAERADLIVDFSQFAGQTLIVYNDAPAPVPAGDPRIDYYTNDPDQSDSGGAPSTLAGYGPNMRTIMQIVVNPSCTGTCSTLNLSALKTAIEGDGTSTNPGIFATTQDAVILPEMAYPASNGGSATDTYIPIQATSVTAWVGGAIGGLTLTNGGAGYTATPAVTIGTPNAKGGTQATAVASLAPTSIGSLALVSGGSGYTSPPTVTINGNGTGALATATLATRTVASAAVTKQGSGYSSIPTVTFSAPPTGTTATGTAVVVSRKVTAITITNPGSGYVTAPTITISGGGGSGATATANLAPAAVASLTLTNPGTGYTTATVNISGGGGSGASATATITPTVVASVALVNAGSGYTSAPTVTFEAPQTTGSAATATATPPTSPLVPKTIQELFTLDYGRMNATLGVELPFTNFLTQTTIPYGYVDPPTEIFKDGETQFWKITHNGVDTHFIHFHLFTVQVINRVGWDGAIKPPDPYELGLKDTVRMNPLEDIVVALRPLKQTLPWPVPNSVRPMDVTQPVGAALANEFTNVDPANQPAAVTNTAINFGWEYVWHCHILGHEENDMMRAMVFAVSPAMPSQVTPATGATKGTTTLQVSAVTVGDSATTALTGVPSGFTVERSTSATGPWTPAGTVAINPSLTVVTPTSITVNATFTDTGLSSKKTYFYRVKSNNLVGYTQTYAAPAAGYPNVSADSAFTTTPISAVAK